MKYFITCYGPKMAQFCHNLRKKDRSCLPLVENNYCSPYELRECFPCVASPISYFLVDRFPFVQWLSKYSPSNLISDIIAGLTVGLMVVPQALAYASIAQLPLEYGLYSSFMGCFVYAIFGSSKDVTLGPTAIMSLLVASKATSIHQPDSINVRNAVALTLLSGLVQFIMGICNIGFVIDFIPFPVINGFTSAAAITIALGQVKHLLGISSKHKIGSSTIKTVEGLIKYLPDSNKWDIILGLTCIALVVFLKYFKLHNERLEKREGSITFIQKLSYKFIWLVCTGRNAIVVIVSACIAYALASQGKSNVFSLVKKLPEGIPSIKIPTINEEVLKDLNSLIIVAALIGLLESIAIGKAFARQYKYKIVPSQELIAIGLANVVGSFVQSYPVTGSFSRTAVNAQSGVKTQLGGIFTGGVVLLALAVLTPSFHYIPKTSLAAIIISAVLTMVDYRSVYVLWRVRKLDLFVLLMTFVATLLLGIEYGVALGVSCALLSLLYRAMRPRHNLFYSDDKNLICVEFEQGLTYPSVEYITKRVTTEIEQRCNHGMPVKMVLLECSRLTEMDYTVALALNELSVQLESQDIQLSYQGLQCKVRQSLEEFRKTLKKNGDDMMPLQIDEEDIMENINQGSSDTRRHSKDDPTQSLLHPVSSS